MMKTNRSNQTGGIRRRNHGIILLTGILCAAGVIHAETLFMRVDVPDPVLVTGRQGATAVQIEGYGLDTKPGYPALPSRQIWIPLPAGCRLNQVTVLETGWETVAASVDLEIKPPFLASDGMIQPPEKDAFDRNRIKSLTGGFYPETPYEILETAADGQKPEVRIRLAPLSYHAGTRHLRMVRSYQIFIDYDTPALPTRRSLREPQGSPVLPQQETEDASLLIIGSEILGETLRPFIFWKSCLGLTVRFMSLEEILQDSHQNAVDKIRAAIIAAERDGTTHVLLIGHIDTLPMKVLYPDPKNHKSGGVPTDLYYSSFNDDWDKDRDGFPGEFEDDGIFCSTDISLGRIPWNDTTAVGGILRQSIEFERNQDVRKKQAMLLGAISNFAKENNQSAYATKTDGAVLMELMKQNIFSMRATTLYEKQGLNASEYDCDLPLTQSNFHSALNSDLYGCVAWWSHGSYHSASRKWWHSDNGNGIPENMEIRWERFINTNSLPEVSLRPIFFANACDNGWPELPSLGRELIRRSASGVVSSSRNSWAVSGWKGVEYGGNASLAYFFWQELVNRSQTAAASLNAAKTEYSARFNSAWQHLHNLYAYNYYGDPTLTLTSPEPVFGGLRGTVQNTSNDSTLQNYPSIEIESLNIEIRPNEDGTFSRLQIPPGVYEVNIQGNEWEPINRTVEIVNGTWSSLDLEINRRGIPQAGLSDSILCLTVHEDQSAETGLIITNTGTGILNGRIEFSENPPAWFIAADTCDFSAVPEDSLLFTFGVQAFGLTHGDYRVSGGILTNDPDHPRMPVHFHIQVIDTLPPAPVDDLTIESIADSLLLSWTAPGDNGYKGQAERIEVWLSQDIPDPPARNDAESLVATLVAAAPGKQQTLSLPVQCGYYYLRIFDDAGHESHSNIAEAGRTGISDQDGTAPDNFVFQNFPNPFNGNTTIRYTLSAVQNVRVTVFNTMGQKVRLLSSGPQHPGSHAVTWDGRDESQQHVSSGIYIFEVHADQFRVIKKMTCLR